jgi:hypothetical protein
LYSSPTERARWSGKVLHLVQKWRGSLRVTTNRGELPLHFALGGDPLDDVIKILVEESPSSIRATAKDGRIALYYAVTTSV